MRLRDGAGVRAHAVFVITIFKRFDKRRQYHTGKRLCAVKWGHKGTNGSVQPERRIVNGADAKGVGEMDIYGPAVLRCGETCPTS